MYETTISSPKFLQVHRRNRNRKIKSSTRCFADVQKTQIKNSGSPVAGLRRRRQIIVGLWHTGKLTWNLQYNGGSARRLMHMDAWRPIINAKYYTCDVIEG